MSALKLELPHPVSGRLQVVDELKGLAIILVVLYHFGGALAWNNTLHGDLGVDIFVILSGVGLAFGSRYEGARAFLIRRLARIMPAYWLILTLYGICNAHFLQLHDTPADLAVHYLGLQGWFGDGYGMAINDSFWFITLILSLYLLFCLCQPLMDSPGRLLLAGAAVSVTIGLAFFFTGQAGMFAHIGLRLPGFFVGILLGRLLKAGRLELKLSLPLVLAVLLITYVPYTQGVIFYTPVVALSLMGAYAFGWKALASVRIEKPVARALKFLGDHSLEIFLIHQPLMRQYNLYLQGRWFNITQPSVASLSVGMIIALVVTLAASVELHRLMQKIPVPARSPA